MILLPVANGSCSLVPAMNISYLGLNTIRVSWSEDEILSQHLLKTPGKVMLILYQYNREIEAANDIVDTYTI